MSNQPNISSRSGSVVNGPPSAGVNPGSANVPPPTPGAGAPQQAQNLNQIGSKQPYGQHVLIGCRQPFPPLSSPPATSLLISPTIGHSLCLGITLKAACLVNSLLPTWRSLW